MRSACFLISNTPDLKRLGAWSLEVDPNLITRWIKEHEQDNDGQAFRGNGKPTPEQEEIRQLKAKVRQFEMDKIF